MPCYIKEMTTLNDLNHPVGSKIGPAHLPWSQDHQNQNSLKSKVEEDMTTINDSHNPVGSKIGPAYLP